MFPHTWSHLLGSAPLYIYGKPFLGREQYFLCIQPQAGSAWPSQLTEFPKLFSWRALWFFSSLINREQNCLIPSPSFSFWMSAVLSLLWNVKLSPWGSGVQGKGSCRGYLTSPGLFPYAHVCTSYSPCPFGFLVRYALRDVFAKRGVEVLMFIFISICIFINVWQ